MKSPLFFILLTITLTLCAQQKDVPNSTDHPLVTRYPGSVIRDYSFGEYDQYKLRNAPKTTGAFDEIVKFEALEGKITRIVYQHPKERSVIEIYKNYESALLGAGFGKIFACEGDACGVNFGNTYPSGLVGFVRSYRTEQRYIALKREDAKGVTHVALYMVKTQDGPFSRLDIVESSPMQSGLITVKSLTSDLSARGKAVIYGVYFDTNKSEIKPESNPALEAIANLLKENAALKLYVVGHTDNIGGLEANMDLSLKRSQAVVTALSTRYGIAASRLSAKGVGFLAPVTENETEEGRALNRRVELVKW